MSINSATHKEPSPGDWVLIKWGGKNSSAHAVEIADVTDGNCKLKPISFPVPPELRAGIETTRLRLRGAGRDVRVESTEKNPEADKQGAKTVWLITS